jgi:hypothetical protein
VADWAAVRAWASVAALSRDNTRPGRNSRAMCLYNLALVHEAGGALGEAICALRRSEALRTNGTVTRRRKALEATVKATNFRCQTGRVARQKDVRALASEYGAANKLEVTSLDRRDAGEFVVHTVHLDPGERDDGDVEVFADVQYVVLDRQGQLFPLGVLGYDDRTVTYFRSSASFRFAGSHPSRLGTLVLFSLESWGRGDCEHVESSNEISSSDHSELLVCRFVAAPEGGDVACAQVPLGAQEHADALDFADDGPGGGTGASGESSSGGRAGAGDGVGRARGLHARRGGRRVRVHARQRRRGDGGGARSTGRADRDRRAVRALCRRERRPGPVIRSP